MKLLIILSLIVIVVACKKKQQSEPTPVLTKWELVSGHYNVYGTTGVFLYEMEINHSIGTSIQGYRVDSLKFINFDDNFTLTAPQNQCSDYPNCIRIGAVEGILDKNSDHWNIFGFGTDATYNNMVNDTIVFYFQKQNMPYWLNDATPYFNGNLKHIAVKQH